MFESLQQIAVCRLRTMVKLKETLPIETDYRQDGSKLNNECKSMDERVALRDSQQVLSDNHMSRR